MKNKRIEVDVGKIEAIAQDQQEKIFGQVKAGTYLRQLRNDRELSLSELGEKLGVSKTYLSAVEQGVKTMSDHFIREMANFHEIDENIIYKLIGRVPLLAREQLEEDSNLQQLLSNIKRDPRFDDERKQKFFQQIYKMYKEFPE